MIIENIEKEQMNNNLPSFAVGDLIVVSKEIVEGKKKRVQKFEGVVIQRKHARSREAITVRKIVEGSGVEKTFLIHHPSIVKLDIKRRGKVRRAKLFYLRDRIGRKANRIKSKD